MEKFVNIDWFGCIESGSVYLLVLQRMIADAVPQPVVTPSVSNSANTNKKIIIPCCGLAGLLFALVLVGYYIKKRRQQSDEVQNSVTLRVPFGGDLTQRDRLVVNPNEYGYV